MNTMKLKTLLAVVMLLTSVNSYAQNSTVENYEDNDFQYDTVCKAANGDYIKVFEMPTRGSQVYAHLKVKLDGELHALTAHSLSNYDDYLVNSTYTITGASSIQSVTNVTEKKIIPGQCKFRACYEDTVILVKKALVKADTYEKVINCM